VETHPTRYLSKPFVPFCLFVNIRFSYTIPFLCLFLHSFLFVFFPHFTYSSCILFSIPPQSLKTCTTITITTFFPIIQVVTQHIHYELHNKALNTIRIRFFLNRRHLHTSREYILHFKNDVASFL